MAGTREVFVEADSSNYAEGRVRSIRLAVVHGTVTDPGPPNAKAVAGYFARDHGSPSSAHITVDGGPTRYRSVHDGDTAYAAPGANADGLHVECCMRPTRDKAKGRRFWSSDKGQATLREAAKVVGRWVVKHHLPVVWLTPAEVKAGRRGICDHDVVTKADLAPSAGHWDVGSGFPVARFLELVEHYAKAYRADHGTEPKPVSPPPSPVEFPLPAGEWYGVPDPDPRNHSGVYSARDARGVAKVQDRLRSLGYYAGGDSRGHYRIDTADAVRRFQHRHRLVTDQLVGAHTWAVLFRKDAKRARS